MVLGDVAPVKTVSPTPKLFDDSQIPSFRALAAILHRYDCKLALQVFHPEYDVPEVGRLVDLSGALAAEARAAEAAGDTAAHSAKLAESQKVGAQVRETLNYGMQHFASEASAQTLADIRTSMVLCARRALRAGVDAIEIHGDRLLGALCSPLLNHRSDAYGGQL